MLKSAPTNGARSVLLITSKSERVIPGPPLRGIFSPCATSITKIVTSAKSGLKVADKLSPPDSIKTISTSGKRATISSTASKFIEASSRIAVCGQPPVSTPIIRSGGSKLFLVKNSASSWV